MAANKLKPNPDKTEFVVFRSKVQWAKLAKLFCVNMFENYLKTADAVRNLGVWFDSDLTSKHVRVICKSCFGHGGLRRLSNYLTRDALVTDAKILVSRCLDYRNSLFRSHSSYNIRKLQTVRKLPRLPNAHIYLQFTRSFIGSLFHSVTCVQIP